MSTISQSVCKGCIFPIAPAVTVLAGMFISLALDKEFIPKCVICYPPPHHHPFPPPNHLHHHLVSSRMRPEQVIDWIKIEVFERSRETGRKGKW